MCIDEEAIAVVVDIWHLEPSLHPCIITTLPERLLTDIAVPTVRYLNGFTDSDVLILLPHEFHYRPAYRFLCGIGNNKRLHPANCETLAILHNCLVCEG